jgi:hypothetical protein
VRASRWSIAALLVAAMMTIAAGGFLAWSISARHNAQADLRRARAALANERSRTTDATARLTKARSAARGLKPPMGAVTTAADAVAAVDGESLAAMKATVDAGVAANVAGYNAAVAQLNTVNPSHDAALEQLRVAVNTLVTGLDPLRG